MCHFTLSLQIPGLLISGFTSPADIILIRPGRKRGNPLIIEEQKSKANILMSEWEERVETVYL